MLNKQGFSLVWIIFIKIMLNTSNSDSLHGQGHYGFKWHFSIFPLAGLIKLVILNFENSFNGSIDFLPFAEATILVIIFWEFLMLYQIFFSPQVKWSVRFVKNYTSCLMNCWMGNIRKSSKFQRIITLCPENFVSTRTKLLENGNWTLHKN